IGYQSSLVEILNESKVNAKGVRIKGDKHSRLTAASLLFEQGKVLFPADESCSQIIDQILGFGVEKHDDLVDAVSMTLNYLQTQLEYKLIAGISWLGPNGYQNVYRNKGVRFKDEK
ncbi:hypothetical protein KC644_04015, partial [Candidatus Berkelbacteria bacterium]|nr:hypothetical protein [Candidatus Berkelbacteria bacterium]